MENKPNIQDKVNEVYDMYTEIIEETNALISDIMRKRTDLFINIEPIIKYIVGRVKTVKLLILDGNIIDSEIVMRAMTETFSKFFYIISSKDKEIINTRLEEYWRMNLEIDDLNISIRNKKIISEDPRLKDDIILRSGILSPSLEEKYKKKYHTKNDKGKNLEQLLNSKYQFGTIIHHLSIEAGYNGVWWRTPIAMKNEWYTSTHFTHGTSPALAFILRRERKSEIRQRQSNTMHYLKVMRTLALYTAWIHDLLTEYLGTPSIDKVLLKFMPYMHKSGEISNMIKAFVTNNPEYDGFRNSSSS